MIFSVKRREGLLYPLILLLGECEAFEDDAVGGCTTMQELRENLRRSYGQEVTQVSQHTLMEEAQKRQRERLQKRPILVRPFPAFPQRRKGDQE